MSPARFASALARRIGLTIPPIQSSGARRGEFRARLSVTTLEDRTVPTPVVTIAALSDVAEGGYGGQFRVTRLGDLSATPAVSYTLGGAAASAADSLSHAGSFAFVPGSAAADIFITALRDNLVEGDETVALTPSSGSGYTVDRVGTTAVPAVTDVMYSGTFERDGTSTLVTVNDVAGEYLWNYRLTNTSRPPAISTFSLDIEDTSVVYDLGNDRGWTGSVDTDYVRWTGGPGIDGGGSGDFWFRTPRVRVHVNDDFVLVPTAPLRPETPYVPPAVVSGSITAVRDDGTGSAEGCVAENNDNYNFYGDPDTALEQTEDRDELGKVAGEDDLVPLRIAAVTGASSGDVLNLAFDTANIRLWRTPDKSGSQVTPATAFNPRVQNIVYVEGTPGRCAPGRCFDHTSGTTFAPPPTYFFSRREVVPLIPEPTLARAPSTRRHLAPCFRNSTGGRPRRARAARRHTRYRRIIRDPLDRKPPVHPRPAQADRRPKADPARGGSP